jgi:hypothetical protein
MSTILHLVQDMSNRMIDFERKGVTSNSYSAESSSQAVLRKQPTNYSFHNQTRAIPPGLGVIYATIIMRKVLVRLRRGHKREYLAKRL